MSRQDAWDAWGPLDAWHDGTSAAVEGRSGVSGVMVSEAVLRSRDLLMQRVGASAPHWPQNGMFARSWAPLAADGLPEMGKTRWLGRMSSWARKQVYQAELMHHVRLKDDPAEWQAQMVHVASDGSQLDVATIVRPTRTVFDSHVDKVVAYSAQRAERTPEIHTQVVSYMPFLTSICHLEPQTTPYTFELLIAAVQFASTIGQRMKQSLVCPRPSQLSPKVQPMIEPPVFFAYPSGHAAQAFMLARLLERLSGKGPGSTLDSLLQQQAELIATNRVIAGVHFPVDSMAGRVLGASLAEYFAHRCDTGGWVHRTFNGRATGVDKADVDLRQKLDVAGGQTAEPWHATNDSSKVHTADPGNVATPGKSESALNWLWTQARAEW